jgi:hypothetical protein
MRTDRVTHANEDVREALAAVVRVVVPSCGWLRVLRRPEKAGR